MRNVRRTLLSVTPERSSRKAQARPLPYSPRAFLVPRGGREVPSPYLTPSNLLCLLYKIISLRKLQGFSMYTCCEHVYLEVVMYSYLQASNLTVPLHQCCVVAKWTKKRIHVGHWPPAPGLAVTEGKKQYVVTECMNIFDKNSVYFINPLTLKAVPQKLRSNLDQTLCVFVNQDLFLAFAVLWANINSWKINFPRGPYLEHYSALEPHRFIMARVCCSGAKAVSIALKWIKNW